MTEASVIDRAALNRLLEILGNDPELLSETLDEFFEDAPTFIAAMSASLEKHNAEDLRTAAHSLKSNSASFGALALAEKCRDVEMLAKAGTFDGIAEGIAEIEQEYPRAKAELESIRATA